MTVVLDEFSFDIPDGIQPIVAYRAWFLGTNGVVTPVLYSLNGAFGYSWVPGWNRSQCLRIKGHVWDTPPHESPMEGCWCGFWAVKDLAQMALRLASLHARPELRVVLGKVDLAGTVIEHDFGYRAERARITGILSASRPEDQSCEVAAAYGVTVSGEPSYVSDQVQAAARCLPSYPKRGGDGGAR